jgi:hypothetical protein
MRRHQIVTRVFGRIYNAPKDRVTRPWGGIPPSCGGILPPHDGDNAAPGFFHRPEMCGIYAALSAGGERTRVTRRVTRLDAAARPDWAHFGQPSRSVWPHLVCVTRAV